MIAASRPGYGSRECVYASTTDTFDEDADLDFIAIERALNGQPVTLTLPEKIHTARLLDERGFGTRAISARVGSARETITGWKAGGWKPSARSPQCVSPRTVRKRKSANQQRSAA